MGQNQRILVVRPDFNGTGIVNEKNEMVSYSEIMLPADLAHDFMGWIKWYWDYHYNTKDFAFNAFNARGLELAKKLKVHLRNLAHIYFDHQEILLDSNGQPIVEEKSATEKLLYKIKDFEKVLDEYEIDDDLRQKIENANYSLKKAVFVNKFKQFPTLLAFGDFEIKDTVTFNDQESDALSIWADYKDQLFDFLNMNWTSEYNFYDKEKIIRTINEDYADEEDMELNEEEFLIQFIDKVAYLLNEMYTRVKGLWLLTEDFFDDIFNDKSIFVTAIKDQFLIDIEGIKELQNYVKKYLPDHITPEEKVKKAEEIALTAHKGQNYGEHKGEDDYFIYHLDYVRNKALRISKDGGIHEYKIEIVALLHDVLEDTSFPANEIRKLFGEGILNAIQALTYQEDMNHAQYFKKISDNRISKIVKAADRIVNISQLKDVLDDSKRDKLFNKYLSQYRYFENYNIYPEAISDTFSSLIFD